MRTKDSRYTDFIFKSPYKNLLKRKNPQSEESAYVACLPFRYNNDFPFITYSLNFKKK